MERKLLVVGARPESLGMHVAAQASQLDWLVTTAGILGDEDCELDVHKPSTITKVIKEEMPHSIVCTVGINTGPTSSGSISWTRELRSEMETNYLGPMSILHEWVRYWRKAADMTERLVVPFHFVAISSNSASIARSRSAAYCGSKAALSMGLRCVAREQADTELTIYGYEPGWIEGTPQSKRTAERFSFDDQEPASSLLHRIPGNRTINPASLAHLIVSNLNRGRHYLNGCTLRLDGGEQ